MRSTATRDRAFGAGALAGRGRGRCGRRSGPATGRGRYAARLGGDADPADGRGTGAARVRICCVAAVLGCADGVLLARPDAGVIPGGTRARAGVAGRGAARVRLRQPALGCRPTRGRRGDLESPLPAPARPLRFPRQPVHPGDAAGGVGRSSGALPQERLLARPALPLARRAGRAVRGLARPCLQPPPARDPASPGRRAIPSSSSTRSAISPWSGRPPTSSSRSSRAATNAARSSSPATAASSNGARSSATPWSPAALSDRLVHRATMTTLKGKSYRLRERGSTSRPPLRLPRSATPPDRRQLPPPRSGRERPSSEPTAPKSTPQERFSRPRSRQPHLQPVLSWLHFTSAETGALFGCA